MCGRFHMDSNTLAEIEKIVRKIDSKRAKTGDIFPSDPALILRPEHKRIVAEVMEWGYNSPFDSKLLINARSETIEERPMFKRDFETRRCVIPADKFYEWKKLNAKNKEKYDFFVPNQVLYMAGIYQKAQDGEHFAILTRAADGCMKGIHHRMPVILHPDEMEGWMFSKDYALRIMNGVFDDLQCAKSEQEEYEQLSLF